jgi:predicted transcriptional regulator
VRDLCTLLFELSNEDRLRILRELKKTPMKLSHVSEKCNFTVPETARNITRLGEASLIVKDVEGCFHLTPYADEALKLLPSFEFLSKHKKYFKTHTFSKLPIEYASSIGVLNSSEFTDQISIVLFNGEKLIREAREFVWIIVSEILTSSLPLFAEAYNRGLDFKKIMPRNAMVPPDILALARDPIFERAARAKRLESRYLDEVDVTLVLSEREASIGFKTCEGNNDYAGFRTSDESAIKWAKSLFLHYWERADHRETT